MATETREQFQARVRRQGFDHLATTIALNADSAHATRLFLDACADGALFDLDADEQDEFLDCLLPRLAQCDRLPRGLVPMMESRFGWAGLPPDPEGATGTRADLVELRMRHSLEAELAGPEATAQEAADVERMVRRRHVLQVVVGVTMLAVALLAKFAWWRMRG